MSNVVQKPKTIREQAEEKVQAEQMEKHLAAMTSLIRQRASTEQALAGINMQIADLEARISDGTA